ncbi:MAG: TonB-dependent receptor, partial [Deltaproteobacteria bacterium]|nr:TonB-dependent receptor [Deltaproteobacteria bacterium]
TDTEEGDLPLRFDSNNFSRFLKVETEIDNVRLGLRHSFTPNSNFIASFIYNNLDSETNNRYEVFSSPFKITTDTEQHLDNDGWTGEFRHLFHWKQFYVTAGIGHNSSERKTRTSLTTVIIPPFPLRPLPPSISNVDTRHTNLYVYSLINFPKNLTLTIGGNIDYFESIRKYTQVNPKIGLTWDLFPGTTLRAAAFRTLKRQLLSDQTIEPTQVAGFNQFFDDTNGTETWRYGFAIDQKFSESVYGGAEYSRRDMEIPIVNPIDKTFFRLGAEEDFIRTYLYWTPHRWLSISAEYQYEWFKRARGFVISNSFRKIMTHRVPLGINFFHPSGLSAKFKATYVDQEGKFGNPIIGSTSFVPGDDQFWVFDGSISYRLPKRFGILSIGAKNMFDNDFKFQDTDPANPRISPESMAYARFTISW